MDRLNIVLMGVTGCGKTTVGKYLAKALSYPFYDADDLHSRTNVEKMSRGEPLTDTDRVDWLKRLRALIETNEAEGERIVLACSALKNAYRKTLTTRESPLFVLLEVSQETAKARLRRRTNHYMPSSLVESQFNALEKPIEAISVNAEQPLDHVKNITLNLVKVAIGETSCHS